MDACSVLLQVSTQDEDSFTVLRNGELLGQMSVPCLESLKILDIPALGEHDIDFETIADLIGEKVR